ncbi:hypothetical protein [Acidithiobacillus sp.]|uniref:hypothetical protein n=1 Tax=Acidithiobacillus sp. TaxID=1872118 RepID=UPI003D04B85B
MTSQKHEFYFDFHCNAGKPQHQVVLGKTGRGMSLEDARRHEVKIVCAKSDVGGWENVSLEDLEEALKNAKIKIVFELDAEDKQVPVSKAHTEEEILAMFPTLNRGSNAGADYYLDMMLSGYKLLCAALEKGGYSVADEDVVNILTHAEVMENVPVWKGISGTQEGYDLDTFLDKLRADTDAGFRVTEGKLKDCFSGLNARLALHSASLNRKTEQQQVVHAE